MFCKVCSKEVNSSIFETVGNQLVCSLACVGLLQSNEEDKCNECQRPVWKDNYYKIDTLFYCSEKCKKKAVKNYLKKYNTVQDLNIRHIENEFFRNDSPIKNLKDLRKEVKQFYKDFDIDETSTIKSIPISCKSTFKYQDNQNNIKINAPMREELDNLSITQPKNKNKILSMKKYVKKYPIIPNRLSKNNSIRNNSFCNNDKRSLLRQKNIENFLRRRKNHSFDNQGRYFDYNDNDDEIVCHLKYVNKKNNNNINKNKKAKLKQTFLKLNNNNIPVLKNKFSKYQIPNPLIYKYNLKESNNSKFNNYRYYERNFENKENTNFENIPCQNNVYFEKKYLNYNVLNTNENKEQSFIERNEIYRYDENYNIVENSCY